MTTTTDHATRTERLRQVIQARIEGLGWSARELARRAELTHGVVVRFLNGTRSVQADGLLAMCEVLGVDVAAQIDDATIAADAETPCAA